LCLPTESMNSEVKLALNNSSGFGGANVCHVLAKP
jgi:3-oxoacyl-(acyl-carrier-protein) synthase